MAPVPWLATVWAIDKLSYPRDNLLRPLERRVLVRDSELHCYRYHIVIVIIIMG